MEFVVLGCGSAFPSPSRGASAYVLRLPSGECWLFDCGEGTQIELMRSEIRPGRLRRLFITHLHGDHVFGLPGLMCTLGQLGAATGEEEEEAAAVEVFGPRGLRRFLREALRLSRSVLCYRYRVHELHFDERCKTTAPFTGDQGQFETVDWTDDLEGSSATPPHPCELVDGARDLWPDHNGCWRLVPADDASGCGVEAAWLPHTAPSFAFLVVQADRPGKLDAKRAIELGVPKGPALGKLKAGETVEVTDAATGEKRVIQPSEVVGPPIRGKRVAVLGDTSDSTDAISTLCPDEEAQRLDLLVHECTLGEAMASSAAAKGHSTPRQAAVAASSARATRLLLTHFSQRYDDEEIEALADEARPHFPGGEILLARRGFKVRL